MSYFDLAAALTRAEAAPILARVAAKAVALEAIKSRSETTCCCSAYGFIHRKGGGACPGSAASAEPTRADIEAEMLALHDRAEARGINSGA